MLEHCKPSFHPEYSRTSLCRWKAETPISVFVNVKSVVVLGIAKDIQNEMKQNNEIKGIKRKPKQMNELFDENIHQIVSESNNKGLWEAFLLAWNACGTLNSHLAIGSEKAANIFAPCSWFRIVKPSFTTNEGLRRNCCVQEKREKWNWHFQRPWKMKLFNIWRGAKSRMNEGSKAENET